MSTTPEATVRAWVIRHADKDTTPGISDPGLTDAGLNRAAAWAERFRPEPLAAVFCTKWRRSIETAGPIAAAHGLTPTIAPEGTPAAQTSTGDAASRAKAKVVADADALASAVRALPPGSRVVIVGHSNTIPAILEALGAGIPGLVITENEYGGVWEASVKPAGP